MADKSLDQTIAENLVLYRKLHGLTQNELAEAIGYSDKSVSKWERGEGTPDVYTLYLLSEIYGVTVSELIGQTGRSKGTEEKLKSAEKDRKNVEKAKKKAVERARKQRRKKNR